RPSAGSGSRRTRPRPSRRLTRCESRDSDALVTSASELIRMIRRGLSESIARTWYSTIPSPESRRNCSSIDQGSQVINRTTDSHESNCASVSQFTGGSPARPRARSVIGTGYQSLDGSSESLEGSFSLGCRAVPGVTVRLVTAHGRGQFGHDLTLQVAALYG